MSAGDYLWRLVVALPLILALAVGTILLLKRGWLRWPFRVRPVMPAAQPLVVIATQTLGPAVRLAVVRFAGRDHLLGLAGTGITLLSTAPADAETMVATSPGIAA
jgi:flagellar biogenesis protein FliO